MSGLVSLEASELSIAEPDGRILVPVVRTGIADCFTESGPYFDLLDRHGCSVADMVAGARRSLELKS